jgi:hypothetical protein
MISTTSAKRTAALALLALTTGLATCAVACGAGAPAVEPESPEVAGGGVATTAPLLVGSSDAADTSCSVVLRSAARPNGVQGAYEIDWTTGGYYVFAGSVDVSDAAAKDAAAVGVAYLSGGAWYDVTATKSVGAPAGFQRYAFRIANHTVMSGTSTTSLMRYRLELAPYVRGTAGGRLFDHNRNPGAFDNYVLDGSDAWSIAEAPAVCPGARPQPQATLEFKSGFTTEQHGALVAGGKVHVSYALDRLPQCRATHNGYPAWGTTASVRFLPGGQLVEGKVNAFETNNGTPTNVAYAVPLDADVPADATSAELWFHNESGAGNTCDTWDSNYGKNYRFDVLRTPPAAPKWAGSWGSAFSRAGTRTEGIAEPTKVDSYVRDRAAMSVEADVYVPGLTDAGVRPELVQAQVEFSVDGGAPQHAWLAFEGRVGNDYRYVWNLPRDVMTRNYWNKYAYTFRFSTDGATWFSIGQGDGPTGGAPRTIVRDASGCATGWPGCP